MAAPQTWVPPHLRRPPHLQQQSAIIAIDQDEDAKQVPSVISDPSEPPTQEASMNSSEVNMDDLTLDDSSETSLTETPQAGHNETPLKKLEWPDEILDTTSLSTILSLENAIIVKQKSRPQVKHGNELTPVARPDFGIKSNKKIRLLANHFQIHLHEDLVLHVHPLNVSLIGPTGKSSKSYIPKPKLKQVIKMWLESHLVTGAVPDAVTDFSGILITRRDLRSDESIKTLNAMDAVVYREEHEDEPKRTAKKYQVMIQGNESKVLRASDMLGHLQSIDVDETYDEEHLMLQCLGIILGHARKLDQDKISIGGKLCFPGQTDTRTEKKDLGHGLIVIRGFSSSVRPATGRLLLNCNVAYSAFYNATGLDQFFREWHITETSTRFQKERFEKLIKGLRIQMNHLPESRNKAGHVIPKIRNIFGLAHNNDGNANVRVETFGGGPRQVQFFQEFNINTPKFVTVDEYWRGRGYPPIRDDGLPVINVGNEEFPMFLPPQACTVLPGQQQRDLTVDQQRKMIEFSADRRPGDNQRSIVRDGLTVLGLKGGSEQGRKENGILDHYGIRLGNEMITVKGRELPRPEISYGKARILKPGKGSWNLAQQLEPKTPIPLKRWSILSLVEGKSNRSEMPASRYEPFLNTIRHLFFGRFGVSKIPAPIEPRSNVSDRDMELAFQRYVDIKVDFLIILLPDDDIRVSLYKQVKCFGDLRYGLQTACMIDSETKSNRKDPMSGSAKVYFSNEGLKINLKLGGSNHELTAKGLGMISKGKTMVVGIDVIHPSPGTKGPSVAAMVASVDGKLAQWPVDLRLNGSRKEMVDLLGSMLEGRLHRWEEINKALPENLIIFRDGVGEGQYETVLEDEVRQIRRVYGGKLTLMIVGKRHHVRFFEEGSGNVDVTNPKTGTIIDRGVTQAKKFEVWMQSHDPLKGIPRPCHYFFLINEIFTQGMADKSKENVADLLERMVYNMCWIQNRTTRAVSIPAPVFYADLACTRGKLYVDMAASGDKRQEDVQVHENLRETMYYI